MIILNHWDFGKGNGIVLEMKRGWDKW